VDKRRFEVDGRISLTFFATSNLILLARTDARWLACEALAGTEAFNRTDEEGPDSFCSVSDKAKRRAMISAFWDLLAFGSSANAFTRIAHTSSTVATPIKEMVIM
jgi:hypothetical protein